ncbi:MAG: GspE/PulE family protein [Candidatus Scalindua sp.]|nr:GspE/PulE family protein [Candidatus Scalindua sp.]
MKQIECKLIDGNSVSGRLERQFHPVEGEVAIRCQGKVQVYSLDQICCILFVTDLNEPHPLPMPGEIDEDVETKGKEIYHVRVQQRQFENDTAQGFYGIPQNQEDGHCRIFFPKTGIVSRRKQLPVEEIQKDLSTIPGIPIQDGQPEQQNLRGDLRSENIEEQQPIPQENILRVLREGGGRDKWKNSLVGNILLSFNLVTKEQVDESLKQQKNSKKKYLGQILIENKIITEKDLLMALSLKFGLSFVDLRDIPTNPKALEKVSIDLVRELHIFPIDFDEKKITIATADPTDLNSMDTLRFHTNRWVEMVIATSNQIGKFIDKFYEEECEFSDVNIDDAIAHIEHDIDSNDVSLKDEAETAPIVRLANKIIMNGIKASASDIHLLPQEDGVKVSFRVNGLLQQYIKLDRRIHKSLVARFKIVALMDITERRLPQDGRFRVNLRNRNVEFRVSCMPGQYGENLVLRVLDKGSMTRGLDQLGLDTTDVEVVNNIVRSAHGMLLVTGPTGSGKSTTLAAVLRDLAGEPKHVLSLEDPIESEVPGINQIQVNEKIGFSFAKALRNVLRHDPDIIMVGEIRDSETAKIAVQASLTGHVLISTLHTNRASGAFSRLVDMGVEPYLVAATVKGVMAQHLIPKLCQSCRTICKPDVKMLGFFAGRGVNTQNLIDHFSPGCEECNRTGISGRVLVYEFLNADREVQKMVSEGVPEHEIQLLACKSGMRTIGDMAVETSQKGLISLNHIIPLFIS